jgi:acetylornithine deacetylase/succinyl-diaminopimelate desuccinylase-like protein
MLVLGEAIKRLGAYEPKRRILPQTRQLLETLVGPFDDTDLDDTIEKAGKLHPEFADVLPCIFATTIAQTRLHGSRARNVIPAQAGVECDCRILPGTGPDELRAELEEAVGDLPVHLEFLEPPTGGTSSGIDNALFDVCQSFFDEHDPGAQLLPMISTGFTDSHFMRERFDTIAYGMWPYKSTPLSVMDEGVHNVNERIMAEDLVYAIRFHLHVVRQIGALDA